MAKGYTHLTTFQRCQIDALLKSRTRVAEIAIIVGCHRATIYREIKRNRGKRGYRHKQAERLSVSRRTKASSVRRKMTPHVVQIIVDSLKKGWSPEQISGRFRNELDPNFVSHETIYRYIWSSYSHGFLFKYLRRKGKKYNKRASKFAGKGCIPNRRDIEERPKIVERKCRFGDIEIDTIIGSKHKGVIVTCVDRSSKFSFIIKVKSKQSTEIEKAVIKRFLEIPILSLTSDNGKEFASHEKISEALNVEFFFAKPYHSWERGLNEHTNGLIREYLPKHMRLDQVTQEELYKIEKLLNERPRKVLNFKTPIEVYNELITQTPIVALQS